VFLYIRFQFYDFTLQVHRRQSIEDVKGVRRTGSSVWRRWRCIHCQFYDLF